MVKLPQMVAMDRFSSSARIVVMNECQPIMCCNEITQNVCSKYVNHSRLFT